MHIKSSSSKKVILFESLASEIGSEERKHSLLLFCPRTNEEDFLVAQIINGSASHNTTTA